MLVTLFFFFFGMALEIRYKLHNKVLLFSILFKEADKSA